MENKQRMKPSDTSRGVPKIRNTLRVDALTSNMAAANVVSFTVVSVQPQVCLGMDKYSKGKGQPSVEL